MDSRWKRSINPDRVYRGLTSELSEWLKLKRRPEWTSAPVAEIFGLARTDRGLGLVCERVASRDGLLAPTLGQVFRTVDPASLARMLSDFAARILACGVIVTDLHAGNIVLNSDCERRGALLLVDGLGSSKRFSRRRVPAINRRRTLEAFAKLAAQAGLQWQAQTATFSAD